MMEPHDVDALAARTKARELAWARDEAGDAVAIDADGTRYILTGDGATLFAVRPHLGGVSRCEEPWVRAVLAEPVNHVTPYVSPTPIVKVKRSRRRTAQVKDAGAGEGCERAGARRSGRGKERPRDAGRAARVLTEERRMKRKRDRATQREGPPCRRCGRPTPPRTNWARLAAVLPVAERFKSQFHHLCRRCFRKQRPNDRRPRGPNHPHP